MKETKGNFLRRSKGITLVALVVTIVILIILATISVSAVLGEGGLIGQAQDAKKQAEDAQEKEKDDMNLLSQKYANIIAAGENEEPAVPTVNLNGYKSGEWTNQNIAIDLSSNITDGKYQYTNDNTTWIDCGASLIINTDQNKTYKFRAVAKDGKVSPSTVEYSIKRDATGPTFVISAKAIDWVYLQIEVASISDSMIGVDTNPTISYYYKLASDPDSKYVLAHQSTNKIYKTPALSAPASYTIKVEISDKLNNKTIKTMTAGTECFVAGTKILTENGLRNIEDIKIGDKVYALNLDNNQRELKKVTRLFRGKTDEIYTITIGKETIKVTPKHQFYVQDKGWIRAYDLKEGDKLVSKSNKNTVINKIEHKRDTNNLINVYNLTVEGHHNYLVTEHEILVHNANASMEI